MKTEIVGTWDGDYQKAVSILYCRCRDIRIRVSGKRLIIKDESIDFYVCIPKGEPIEIPVYPPCDENDDPPIIMEEPKILSKAEIASMSSEQEELQRKWGLLP